jgi:hypothetical protein
MQKWPSTEESSNMIDEKIPPMEVVTKTGLSKLTLFVVDEIKVLFFIIMIILF